jgi:HlyD family secretion protein
MGMDRKIERSKRPLIIKIAIGLIATIFIIWLSINTQSYSDSTTLRVNRNDVTVSEVKLGTFEDYIPIRGSVTPKATVFLDAIEGGRVDEIHVRNGAIVEKGQPILVLSNPGLQLDVISREAQVSEQLNNLRNTRLAMEQNSLSLKSQLVDIDFNILRLERLAERQALLAERNLVSNASYQDTLDELAYQHKRRVITLESQIQDEKMREAQISALEGSVEQLQKNLTIARRNVEGLIVKAPITGQLSSFDAEVGQSKQRGQPLGQIDDIEAFKLHALIDEFYLTRMKEGLPAEATHNGRAWSLTISRVYPQVVNGQFEVDIDFTNGMPPEMRRGQTLQIRVQLGDANQALLLPRGSFIQETGGNWVFILDPTQQHATKKQIRLGRQNSDYFEVIDGLQLGDQVLTSDYSFYADIDAIELE